MQNIIDEMIRSFTGEELRAFKYFINKTGSSSEREDLKLVDLIRKGAAYDKNNNAVKQIRKRLKVQLKQFALLENLSFDEASEINSMIEMAKYLFRKNLYEQGWYYLVKAEQMVTAIEDYKLLDIIYNMQLTYIAGRSPSSMPKPSVLSLLNKRDENVSLAKFDGDANAAYALLRCEIEDMLAKGTNADIDTLISKTFDRYKLPDNIYDKPKIYGKIINIVCRALREQRDYQKLKVYGTEAYKMMKRKKILDKVSPDFMMEFIAQICMGALHTKDYKTCASFLDIYRQGVERFKNQRDKYIYYDFITVISYADLYICTNKLDEAKRELLSLNKKCEMDKRGYNKIYYMLRINLLAVHFKCGDYDECASIFSKIVQEDEDMFLKDGGGVELMLYTELYGVMIHYENDDANYAFHLLNRIKRKYADILKLPASKREVIFIKMIEKIINDTSYAEGNKFRTEYDKFIKLKAYIPGDREYISLNAWLTSKLTGKTYYECFLEQVR